MLSRILIALTLLFMCSNSYSNAEIPTKDIKGSKDHSLLGRIEGAYIVAYRHNNYDEFTMPLSKLMEADGRDKSNNMKYEPKNKKTLEGSYTRLVYLLPKNISPLGALRSYQEEIKSKGGDVLFECKDEECGGDSTRSSGGGGGRMSLAMYLFPGEKVTEGNFTNGNCAMTEKMSGQRYAVYNMPSKNMHISLLAYSLNDDLYCKEFTDYTILIFDIIEEKNNNIKVNENKGIGSSNLFLRNGKMILKSVTFDKEKVTTTPEFEEEFKKITELIKNNKKIELLVVSHTDNQDTLSMNMSMSQKRADALVKEMIENYDVSSDRLVAIGVGSASPITSNNTKEGRIINERIEIVVR